MCSCASNGSGSSATGDSERAVEFPDCSIVAQMDAPRRLTEAVYGAWHVTFETDVPVSVVLRIDDGTRRRDVVFDEMATSHDVPLLGLKPNVELDASLVLTDAMGETCQALIDLFQVPAYGGVFPDITVLANDTDAMEPGYRFMTLKSPQDLFRVLAVFDPEMELVWLYDGAPSFDDTRFTDKGTFLGLVGGGAREITVFGDVLWSRDGPVAANFHHELFPQSDGTMLTMGYVVASSPNYPQDYDNPEGSAAPATLLDNTVLKLSPDGEVLTSLALSKVLDTGRLGFGGLDRINEQLDWVHANGVISTDDGSIYVSARHQDAIVKLDPNRDIQWILADPAGWSEAFVPYLLEPIGDLTWPYHQHAPELTADGLLVMFDNHNRGHNPYGESPPGLAVSRAVAFRVDESAMTVTQEWEIEGSEPLFSGALGDADVLPVTGNVLIDFGLVERQSGMRNAELGLSARVVRLVEAHPSRPDQPVLDVMFSTPASAADGGVRSYRAEHLPSIYTGIGEEWFGGVR